MKLHQVETGERYSDDSGWGRRVAVDTQKDTLLVEIDGSQLVAKVEDIQWLLSALVTVARAVDVPIC